MALSICRVMIGASVLLSGTLQAQGAEDRIALSGKSIGNFASTWQITFAEAKETEHVASVYVRVRNISGRPIAHARFYGELTDSLGRRCFAVVFDLAETLERIGGQTLPVLPGEERTLYASSLGLAPASAPASIRMSLLDTEAAETWESLARHKNLAVPPVIMGGIADNWLYVTIPEAAAHPEAGTRDVVFARAAVSLLGKPMRVEVLGSASEGVARWFDGFVRQLRFVPGWEAGRPEDEAFVLVRIHRPSEPWEAFRHPVRESAWIKALVGKRAADDSLPIINVLSFSEVPYAAGKFEYRAMGTDWCNNLFDWRPETVADRVTRTIRVWRTTNDLSR